MRARLTENDRQRLFASSDEGALCLDAQGCIVGANARLADLLLYRPDELAGRTLAELGRSRSALAPGTALRRLVQQGYLRHDDLPLATRDGRQIHFDFYQVGMLEGGVRLIRCAPRSGRVDADLAAADEDRRWEKGEIMVAVEELKALAQRELERNRRGRRSLSVLSIALDRCLAEEHADDGVTALRRTIEAACSEALRTTDRVAATAATAFVAVLPDADSKGALRAAERLRTAVAGHSLPLPGEPGRIATVSVGVATTRAGRVAFDALRLRADDKCRLARRSGGNRVAA